MWRDGGQQESGPRVRAVVDLHVLDHQWSLGMGIDPSGRFVIAGSDPAQVWNTTTGRCVLTIPEFSADTVNWAFADEGSVLITGGRHRAARLLDCASGEQIRVLRRHWRAVRCVALSADGRTAATGSDDGSLRLWDVASGRRLRTLRSHNGPVYSVAVNGNGTVALCGTRGAATAWEVTTGRRLHAVKDLGGIARIVRLSHDGRDALVFADETTRVWDTATGQRAHAWRSVLTVGRRAPWPAAATSRSWEASMERRPFGR